MDTKALRQKILDLAIHGKLVPQDPNDEPASVLLQRIREEKERLIKEGKIKKGKKSAKTSDTGHYENAPFEVPSSWEWCNLEELSYDLTYGTSEKSLNTGLVPVLRMGNISRQGRIDWNNLVYTNNKDDIEKYALQNNDLLFNRTNSSEWVGKTAIYKESIDAIYAGYIIRIRTVIVNPDYINYVMNSPYHRNWCNEVKTDAVNQSNINGQKLSKFRIPLPPLAEQHRIVAEIERWFSLIDIIESGKASLQVAVKQAKSKILDLAIHGKLVPQDPADEPATELLCRINPKAEIASDNAQYGKMPFDVPSSWEWTTLGNICSIKGGKRIPKGMSFSKEKTEHIYLRVTNMKSNTIILDDLKYISDEVYSLIKNYTINSSDLYLTIAGTIGSVGIIPQEVDGMNLTENAAKLTNIACEKGYLLYALQSTVVQEHFTSRFHQVAQPKLSIETANSAKIPLPPLPEQRRIVSKIEELFARLDRIEAEL